jgi:hypothetical protein
MSLVFIAAAILWAACIWPASNVSYAAQPNLHEWGQILGPDPFACKSHDDWSKMTAELNDDAVAAMDFAKKNCKELEETTVVEVEKISSDAWCVKPRGENDCFWILPAWVRGLDDNWRDVIHDR